MANLLYALRTSDFSLFISAIMSWTSSSNCSGDMAIVSVGFYVTLVERTTLIVTMNKDNLQSLMAQLHEDVATELKDRINSGDATTADISAAIKFLKDNNVTVVVEESKPVMNLVESLPFPTAEEA
ncbi:MAG: hypothetical protein GY753_06985 [Gammaproteobacteria bacterium]|nr:hypothetical protein [Gammaproteobacteria bacterium]